MSVRYRVACACGQSVTVNEAQAGATTACGCGASVSVPMLRELRKLPQEVVAESGSSSARSGGAWNARQSLLFVAGAATFLALVVAGILYVGRARLNASWTPELQQEVDNAMIDSLEPAQTIGAFHEMRRDGIGEQQPSSVMLNRETHQRLGGLITWTLTAAAAGAVVWLAVVFVMPKN